LGDDVSHTFDDTYFRRRLSDFKRAPHITEGNFLRDETHRRSAAGDRSRLPLRVRRRVHGLWRGRHRDDKLYEQDATWRHFFLRQHGYEGETPETMESLTPDHPQIRFRKEHLTGYLVKLVTAPYDGKMVAYLDVVGSIHTTKVGNKSIHVPLVQMNALMGFVADAFNATILAMEIPDDAKAKALRAFSKLLWIQNDMIVRHYAG
jgi:hypothetical protein